MVGNTDISTIVMEQDGTAVPLFQTPVANRKNEKCGNR